MFFVTPTTEALIMSALKSADDPNAQKHLPPNVRLQNNVYYIHYENYKPTNVFSENEALKLNLNLNSEDPLNYFTETRVAMCWDGENKGFWVLGDDWVHAIHIA